MTADVAALVAMVEDLRERVEAVSSSSLLINGRLNDALARLDAAEKDAMLAWNVIVRLRALSPCPSCDAGGACTIPCDACGDTGVASPPRPMTSPPFAGLDARLAALARLSPEDEREGLESVTDPARETARRIARVMLAMGGTPHIYPGTDRGGCHVEVAAVTVFIDGVGRVASVVTLEPGDET